MARTAIHEIPDVIVDCNCEIEYCQEYPLIPPCIGATYWQVDCPIDMRQQDCCLQTAPDECLSGTIEIGGYIRVTPGCPPDETWFPCPVGAGLRGGRVGGHEHSPEESSSAVTPPSDEQTGSLRFNPKPGFEPKGNNRGPRVRGWTQGQGPRGGQTGGSSRGVRRAK